GDGKASPWARPEPSRAGSASSDSAEVDASSTPRSADEDDDAARKSDADDSVINSLLGGDESDRTRNERGG
ncbi:MAG: hypothetical protein ACOC0P_01385, partial [Planctomycetota bacterium]